jgi:hypothetical protein
MLCDRYFRIIEKKKKVCSTKVAEEVAALVRDAKYF